MQKGDRQKARDAELAERQKEAEARQLMLNTAMIKLTEGLLPCPPMAAIEHRSSAYFLNALNEFTGGDFTTADVFAWLSGRGFEYTNLQGELLWCFGSGPFAGADTAPPLAGETN